MVICYSSHRNLIQCLLSTCEQLNKHFLFLLSAQFNPCLLQHSYLSLFREKDVLHLFFTRAPESHTLPHFASPLMSLFLFCLSCSVEIYRVVLFWGTFCLIPPSSSYQTNHRDEPDNLMCLPKLSDNFRLNSNSLQAYQV